MYGFVSNVTGDIYIGFATEDEATEMARSMGLTRVTIRNVVERPGTVTQIIAARTRAAHEAAVPAGVPTVTMDEFLAGGQ